MFSDFENKYINENIYKDIYNSKKIESKLNIH